MSFLCIYKKKVQVAVLRVDLIFILIHQWKASWNFKLMNYHLVQSCWSNKMLWILAYLTWTLNAFILHMRVQNLPIQKHKNTRFVLLVYALHLQCENCSYWLCCAQKDINVVSRPIFADKLPVTWILWCCTLLGHSVNLKCEVCLPNFNVKKRTLFSVILFCKGTSYDYLKVWGQYFFF